VSAFPLLARFGLNRGFDHYDSALGLRDDALGGMRQRSADTTLHRLEPWFEGRKGPPPEHEVPLFLWVHFFDPHADYAAPPPWPSVHPGDPYRAEVAFVDQQVGRLLETLRRRRTSRELRLVVTSDHGEGLSDHDESTHGALIHTTTIRVPILVRTGSYEPDFVAAPVSVERIPATLLALLGLDPELNPGSAPELTDPPTPVHAETLYPYFNFGWSGLRSREENGWRLITGPSDRLYRIVDDPGEVRNVAAAHPEIVADLKEGLEEEWAKQEATAFRAAPRDLSADEAEALRSLGYVAGGTDDHQVDGDRAFRTGADPHLRLAIVDSINLGLTLLRDARPSEAVDTLRRVVEEEPANRFALEHLARALRDAGRLEEARATFREAVATGRCPELVHLELANVEKQLENRAGAEEALAGALAANPRSVEARKALAQLLVNDERFEPALVLLDEALQIRPRATGCHVSIAQIYERLGRYDEAAAHWRRLLELDPDGRFGDIARAALQRGDPGAGSR
jgi:Flp pilus assembly protein TadD